jgi:site-specific DNA-methyltransferase (adenine-specific)
VADESVAQNGGSGSDVSRSIESSTWRGYGTSLKPAFEPIILARKPLSGTVAQNVTEHGCGALNVNECLVPSEGGKIRENEESQNRRYTENGSTNFAATPGPRGGGVNGRWPANVLHDGSEEVVRGFPETTSGTKQAGQYQRGGVYGRESYGYTHDATTSIGDSGSAARFFYCAKASGSERDDNTHATVKPLALMEYLCRLIKQPARNLVLDPFAGSGTTLLACELLGIPCIGIESDEDHCKIIIQRFSRPSEPYLL